MGNRGGIEIQHSRQGNGTVEKVCLYSHWEGCFLAEFVRRSLSWTHDRWTDAPYLTKFMVLDITEGRAKEMLDLAICGELYDLQHRIVVVDVPRQQVRFEDPRDRSDVSGSWSFGAYLEVLPEDLDRAYHKDSGGELTAEGRDKLERRLREISIPPPLGASEDIEARLTPRTPRRKRREKRTLGAS